MGIHKVAVVYRSVVGCEEEQVFSFTYFSIEHLQEMCQVFVQLHIYIVVFLATSAVGVSDGVGG